MFTKPIIITGPTSVGKTTLAVNLAERLNATLINADKFHTYNTFKTGIGVTDSDYRSISRKLYNILWPTDMILHADEYYLQAKSIFDSLCKEGHPVIFEGCSFSYNEKLIMNKQELNDPIIIGLKFENKTQFRSHIVRRVNNLFEIGLLEETENLLDSGYQNTYVMQKGIIYKYCIEHLNKKIDLATTKQLITKHFFLAAAYQLARYKLVPEINWLDTTSDKTLDQLSRLVESVN